jgi:hypothetical protein
LIDVTGFTLYQAAFLKKFQGKKKKCPLKLMLPNESKEFPVLSLDELLIMCMEHEITSIRQFVFLVLVWLLQVRAHGDQNSKWLPEMIILKD